MAELSHRFLGAGWRFPIRVTPRGGIALSRGDDDIQEAIWIILATSPGERVMRPSFGCGIYDLVFEPNSPATHGAVAARAREALTTFEPRIELEQVRVEAAEGEPNKLLIRVDYRVRATNASHNLVYPFYIREGAGG
jgi:phage baseplate assembly protein W